jgi:hypothetical protein
MNIKTNTHHKTTNGAPLAELQPSERPGQTETPNHHNTETLLCPESSPCVRDFGIRDSLATPRPILAPDRGDGGNYQLSTINH